MATTKSTAKASPAKRPAPATSKAVKPEPVTKAAARKPVPKKAAPKAVPKVAAKPAAKPAAAKPQKPGSKKPANIPLEKRKHYIEMAAYYIAERRGFAPGNLLDDWVQAEAEIDRLLAEGRLGG
jgi:hypothetical protein